MQYNGVSTINTGELGTPKQSLQKLERRPGWAPGKHRAETKAAGVLVPTVPLSNSGC